MSSSPMMSLPVKTVITSPQQQQLPESDFSQQNVVLLDDESQYMTPENCNLQLLSDPSTVLLGGPSLSPPQMQTMKPRAGSTRTAPPLSNNIDKTKLKTKTCKNWSNGNFTCAYARCAFAHGDHEKINTLLAPAPCLATVNPDGTLCRQSSVSSLTSSNLQFVSPPQQPPTFSRLVHSHVLQQQQNNSPLTTPVAQPLTPMDSNFSSPVPMSSYDRQQFDNTPMQTPLTPMDFTCESQRMCDNGLVQFQLEEMDALRTPLENAGMSFPTCPSHTSSFYRYDPYPEVVDHVTPIAVSAYEAEKPRFEHSSDDDEDPTVAVIEITEDLAQHVPTCLTTMAGADGIASTLRVDHSPSEQMLTSEDASTGEEEDTLSSRAATPEKSKAPSVNPTRFHTEKVDVGEVVEVVSEDSEEEVAVEEAQFTEETRTAVVCEE